MQYSETMDRSYSVDTGGVFLEYCTNCGEHSWCTQHDEKKYAMMAAQLVDSIHRQIGTGVRIYENIPPPKLQWFISRRQFPRLGAFEIYYGNKIIFSKIKKNRWPNIKLVTRKLSAVMKYLREGREQDADDILDCTLLSETPRDAPKYTPPRYPSYLKKAKQNVVVSSGDQIVYSSGVDDPIQEAKRRLDYDHQKSLTRVDRHLAKQQTTSEEEVTDYKTASSPDIAKTHKVPFRKPHSQRRAANLQNLSLRQPMPIPQPHQYSYVPRLKTATTPARSQHSQPAKRRAISGVRKVAKKPSHSRQVLSQEEPSESYAASQSTTPAYSQGRIAIHKTYDIHIPINKVTHKKITYKNRSTIPESFRIVSSDSDFMQIRESEIFLHPGSSTKLHLRFQVLEAPGNNQYIVFIGKNGEPWENILLNVTYFIPTPQEDQIIASSPYVANDLFPIAEASTSIAGPQGYTSLKQY